MDQTYQVVRKKIKDILGLEVSEVLECDIQARVLNGNRGARPAILLALFFVRELDKLRVSDIQFPATEEQDLVKFQNYL